MVVALGPGKFYGSSLPRPRIYNDVKLNDERVDPPVPVLDPLMSWAEEAHWSMGGLNFKRHRLQGRIEGSIKKLRAEREKFIKRRREAEIAQLAAKPSKQSAPRGVKRLSPSPSLSPSPPPAPVAVKRRRRFLLVEDDVEDIEEVEEEREVVKRGPARKLWDDFDRVAKESGLGKKKGSPVKRESRRGSEGVALRTRSQRSEIDEVNLSNSKAKKLKGKAKRTEESGNCRVASATRVSPRLAKRG